MDWGYKAMLTMVSVALVLLVAETFGRRVAGLLAGLPIITAPALLWLASEHGAAFAASCAIGSITACGLMAVFALAYERIGRRRGPAASLAGSLGAAAAVAAPAATFVDSPLRAILFAFVCGVLVLRHLPASRSTAVAQPSRRRAGIVFTAVAAGLISLCAAVVASAFGPFWAGVLAALPIISAAALVHQHLTATHGDIQRFLRGYVAGLSGKALFALTFATLVVQLGAPSAVVVAIAAGLATSFGAVHGLKRVERSSMIACARLPSQ